MYIIIRFTTKSSLIELVKPSDIGTTKDLAKLPILTKDVVRENVKNGKLIARNIPQKNMILNGSSG